MRLLVSLSAAAILGLLLLAGCNSNDKAGTNGNAATVRGADPMAPLQTPAPSDGVRRVTTAELNDLLGKGEAVVVDVRNEAAYKQARIKGAILIPFTEVASHLDKLPKDKLIVTYCA